MALLGSYLILKIDGNVIAETTSVSMKVTAKPLNATSYDSGLNAEFMGGKVSVAMAGTFLMATSGANWSVLSDAFRVGTSVNAILYRNENQVLNMSATIVKLQISGGDAGSLITGGYGLLGTPTVVVSDSVTVDSTIITVDSDLITSDAT